VEGSYLKTLVIYYSFEGNTRFIAETIANSINADILELKPREEIKSKGFMKYVWGGRQVVRQKEPELFPFDKKPEDYDLIFIGTPIWAWTFTPALRTFLTSAKLQNKKIALFCCHDGQAGKTFEKMKVYLNGNTILGETDFIEPLKNDKVFNSNRAKEWAKEILMRG
jgi:flavodoxin